MSDLIGRKRIGAAAFLTALLGLAHLIPFSSPLVASNFRQYLKNPSIYVRQTTLNELLESKDREAIPDLLDFFSERHNPVHLRLLALDVLREIGGGGTFGGLLGRIDQLIAGQEGVFAPSELDQATGEAVVTRCEALLASSPPLEGIRQAARFPFLRDPAPLLPYLASEHVLVRMAGCDAFLTIESDPARILARLAPLAEGERSFPLRAFVWDRLSHRLEPSEHWSLFRQGLHAEDPRIAISLALSLGRCGHGGVASLLEKEAESLPPELATLCRESAQRVGSFSLPDLHWILGLSVVLFLLGGRFLRGYFEERRRRAEGLDGALGLYRSADYMQALSAFGRHADHWPKHGDRAYLHRALCYLKLGNAEAAEEAALALRPERCPLDELYELAMQFEARDAPVAARRYYELVAARDASHGEVGTRLNRLQRQERGESLDASPIYSQRQMAIEVIDPRYQDLAFLGKGGMGSVFAATDSRRKQRVAIKILSPEAMEDEDTVRRFYREAIAVSNLLHPHIPKIMDVKKARLPYYVMEFVEGESLKMELLRSAPLSEDRALSIARDVASALACAHEAGIVHRDVKPGNVVLSPDRGAMLLDFGIARLGGSTTVTKTGQMIGTPQYMAPEQLRGERVDPATDVYALSVILYQAVSGDFPWNATAPYARLQVEAQPLRGKVPEASEGLEALLARGLAREAKSRFADGAALLAALLELEDTQPHSKEEPETEASGSKS